MSNAEPAALPKESFLASLRTARATAVAGLIFAVIIISIFLLIRDAFPYDSIQSQGRTVNPEALGRAEWALHLAPYAAIALLWFAASLNYNFGHTDERLFNVVFTGSAFIYISLGFVATALGAGELAAIREGIDVDGASLTLTGITFNTIALEYAPRVAAVFVLSLSTYGRLRRLMPPWLYLFGTVTGLSLLLVPFGLRFTDFIFPVWVGVLSIYLFIVNPAKRAPARPETSDPADD